jgi:hypothetical protein
MIKFFKLLIILAVISTSLFSLGFMEVASANTERSPVNNCDKGEGYCMLEPLFADQVGKKVTMVQYLSQIYKAMFITAGALATLMFIWGGFEYMMSETGFNKGKARTRMSNAIIGLVLAISSWLIISIINPAPLQMDFQFKTIPGIEGAGSVDGDGGGSPTTPLPAICDGCVAIEGLPIKAGACKGGNTCYINAGTYEKLKQLNSSLKSAGLAWEITEAYPPTIKHKCNCHYTGTCIDANPRPTSSQPLGFTLNTFFDSAVKAGLRPVYEVSTQTEIDTIRKAGYTGTITKVAGVLPHFSVYNVRCEL